MNNRHWKIWVKLGIVLVVVIYILYPFIPKKDERPFRQPYENIVSISIWRAYDDLDGPKRNKVECLKELPLETGIELLDKLRSLEIDCAWFSKYRDVCDEYVEIVYQNGEEERIIRSNCCWRQPDGLWRYHGYHFEDQKLFLDTLAQYY